MGIVGITAELMVDRLFFIFLKTLPVALGQLFQS